MVNHICKSRILARRSESNYVKIRYLHDHSRQSLSLCRPLQLLFIYVVNLSSRITSA